MKTLSWSLISIGIVAGFFILYFGGWFFISYCGNNAFNIIEIGQTELDIISTFKKEPSMRERSDSLFSRYADRPCSSPCVERIWFENKFSLDTQAWSFELDKNRRVINKARWLSP